jgi:L-amino acid N-acyltransferase YncA
MDMIEGTQHVERSTTVNTSADMPPRTWQAADGTEVLIRAIEPGDFELEQTFVNGLSRSTSYMRLMSGRWPTEEEIRRWTEIDRQREGAIIATVSVEGKLQQVGVARYAVEERENEAEMAIVISDAWQHRGLGMQLLSSLIDLARRSGMKRLVGTALSENEAMLNLGRRLGFRVSLKPEAPYITELWLDL